jgi:hypothetical protein
MGLNISHSIIPSQANMVNLQGKFFYARQRTDSAIRQKSALLDSKENFADSESARFRRLSASIGRIFFSRPPTDRDQQASIKTVSTCADDRGTGAVTDPVPESIIVQPLPVTRSYFASCPRARKMHWRAVSRFPAPAAAFLGFARPWLDRAQSMDALERCDC